MEEEKICIEIELENVYDRCRAEGRGEATEVALHHHQMQAVVDTGVVMLILPEEVVDELGLEKRRAVLFRLPDGTVEEREVAGALQVCIKDRSMITDCMVGPTGSEAIVGFTILNRLDLHIDETQRTLVPRPESPIYPMLRI